MRARGFDLRVRDTETPHIRQVRAIRLTDRVRELCAQKTDLLKIISLLDDGRKDLHIIAQVQIVLQHIVPELLLRQRAVRHLHHKGVAQILRPDLLRARIDPLGKLHLAPRAQLEQRQIDRAAAAVTGTLGDVALRKERTFFRLRVEIRLHTGVVRILRPAHELRHRRLWAVGIEHFQPVTHGHHLIADRPESLRRLRGQQCDWLLIPVDTLAHEVIGRIIAHL